MEAKILFIFSIKRLQRTAGNSFKYHKMRISLLALLISAPLFSQQYKSADFKSVNSMLIVDAFARTVSGDVLYSFDIISPIDTIKIDAHQMTFDKVLINGSSVNFTNSGKQLLLPNKLKKGSHKLTFHYTAAPKQTMYFIGDFKNHGQIWTQGQGKYTSHWFPSFDDVNEKVIFNISTAFDIAYTVISNGKLSSLTNQPGKRLWQFTMEKPMSSYLLMLAIGKYDKRTLDAKSGINLELYIEPEDALKIEPTYRYSKQMFDFLENEIGVAYPWGVYKQIPVRDFLYAGMENTSATVFSRDFVVDSIGFSDRNYVNVNAHELAHQWFGDLVTAESGEHHWLQEGFATYYALLAEKDIFGDDYFYWKLYEMAGTLQQAAKSDKIPIMNPNASSLTFYQKGAWALHVLRSAVGEKKFRTAVKAYIDKHQFKSVTTDNFLDEIANVSDYDTAKFKREWLQSSGFNASEAIALLKQNAFMKNYFDLVDLTSVPLAAKKDRFMTILGSPAYFPIKEEVLIQLEGETFDQKSDLIAAAMNSENVKVRQAVAKTLRPIPAEFAVAYQCLLDDKSYITQEIALNALWSQFEDKRTEVLNKTAGRIGMNDKNLRMQWLTMALATTGYEVQKKPLYYDELLLYTTSQYESAVRINAFESLFFLDQNDSNILRSLVDALVHHKWQLTKYARDKIRELLPNKSHREYFTTLAPTLPSAERVQLERLLKG